MYALIELEVPRSIPAVTSKRRGRPRIHPDDASKVAAHRLRKKQEANAPLQPPADPEPAYPTLTGDKKSDEKAKAEYKRTLAKFQAQWDTYLDATGNSMDNGIKLKDSPGGTQGELITGEHDIYALDRIDAATRQS